MVKTKLAVTHEDVTNRDTHSMELSLSHYDNKDGLLGHTGISATLLVQYIKRDIDGNILFESDFMYFGEHEMRAITMYLESRIRPGESCND